MLAFLPAPFPQPIDLDGITVERSRTPSRRLVVVTFIAGEPHA